MADSRQLQVGHEGFVSAELSNELVRIHKGLFGRGPTKARATFAGPDAVVCTFEDTLTTAEHRLVELGEYQRLRNLRQIVQHAREAEFRAAVERITGREVRAFVNGMDIGEDVAAQIFYLVPRPDPLGGERASDDRRVR